MTGLIMSMGRVITSAGFTGFGFQGIGVGDTITESGFTAITHHDKSGALISGADCGLPTLAPFKAKVTTLLQHS